MYQLIREYEDGASCFEVLQQRISNMEQAHAAAQMAIEEQDRRISEMRRRLASGQITRRERFNLELDINTEVDRYRAMVNRRQCLYYEIKGMRKSVDLIIFINNYGGEVTPQNRRQIEAIMNS